MVGLDFMQQSDHIHNISSFPSQHHSLCVVKQPGVRQVYLTDVLLQVLADLVQGEFMQLGSKENENERFAHYLKKTFKKTASLLAYSCKAVSLPCQPFTCFTMCFFLNIYPL